MLWYIYSKSLEERDKIAIINSNGFTRGSFATKLLAAANKFGLKKLAKMCRCIVSGERVSISLFNPSILFVFVFVFYFIIINFFCV